MMNWTLNILCQPKPDLATIPGQVSVYENNSFSLMKPIKNASNVIKFIGSLEAKQNL